MYKYEYIYTKYLYKIFINIPTEILRPVPAYALSNIK